MKKLILFFGFCVLGFYSKSQSNIHKITDYDFARIGVIKNDYSEQERIRLQENRVKSRNSIRSVNGKITSAVYEEFDRAGNVIYKKVSNSKGILVDEIVRKYDQNHNCIYSKHTYDGKTTEVWKNFNDSSRITMSKQYNEKGEYEARIYEYDDNGTKIQKVTLYKLDSLAPVKWMIYSYHDDGSQKRIDYFNLGELVYSWNYECSEKGELAVMKTDTASSICLKTTVDEHGNNLKWSKELDGNGHVISNLSVYSPSGRLKEIAKYYSANDQLIERTLFFEDGGTMTLNYDKKGVGRVVSETVYDIEGQMIYGVFGYGKKQSYTWSDYDNGLLSKMETQRGKSVTIVTYEYSYFQ